MHFITLLYSNCLPQRVAKSSGPAYVTRAANSSLQLSRLPYLAISVHWRFTTVEINWKIMQPTINTYRNNCRAEQTRNRTTQTNTKLHKKKRVLVIKIPWSLWTASFERTPVESFAAGQILQPQLESPPQPSDKKRSNEFAVYMYYVCFCILLTILSALMQMSTAASKLPTSRAWDSIPSVSVK